MFVEIVENAAKVLVLESIRDEALGDLWEFDNQLKQVGRSKFLRLLKSIQYLLSLAKASIILFLEEKFSQLADIENAQARETNIEAIKGYQGGILTTDEIKQVKQYCATRRMYGLKLSRRLLGISKKHPDYWIQLADRIIEKCLSHGEKAIDVEAIANSCMLSSLIRQVESMPPQNVDVDTFYNWVKQVYLDESFLERYVSFDDKTYRRLLVCRTWSLVVYVMNWMPGQESWVHHHGHALDAIQVIRGQMTHWLVPPEHWEENVPFEGSGYPRRHEGPSEVFTTGDVVAIDRRHGHQIANLSDEPLITLIFRFGYPPEDKHWRSTNDTEMFVWNQTEGYFDLIGPEQRRFTSPLREKAAG